MVLGSIPNGAGTMVLLVCVLLYWLTYGGYPARLKAA